MATEGTLKYSFNWEYVRLISIKMGKTVIRTLQLYIGSLFWKKHFPPKVCFLRFLLILCLFFNSSILDYQIFCKITFINHTAYLSPNEKVPWNLRNVRKFFDSSINRHDFSTKTRNDGASKWKPTKFKSIFYRRVLYSHHVNHEGAESWNAF